MDPFSILKLLWRHRIVTVPLIVLTLLLCTYLAFFGPRTYQATASYALIDPDVPTADEIDRDARLGRLNSNNPYLRSSDPSLAVQVLVAKLTSEATAKQLRSESLSDQYTIERVANNSLMVVITGSGDTPELSLATRDRLSAMLIQELQAMQKVDGADDRYLFTALAVDLQSEAQEKISSRMRVLIVALFGCGVLLFGALSIVESVARSKVSQRRSPLPGALQPQEPTPSMDTSSSTAVNWDWDVSEVDTPQERAVRTGSRFP